MLLRINWSPSRAQLRTFGIVGALVCGALAAWCHWRHHLVGIELSPSMEAIATAALATVAALCLMFALAWPRALRPLYLALTALTIAIAFVVSPLMLVTIYYFVIVPMGGILRVTGWDPMRRKLDRGASSYWIRRERPHDVKRYFRTY